MGSNTRLRTMLGVAAAAAVLGATALPLAAQATGTVRGRVIDAATQRPLSGAQIAVVGTGRRAVTNAAGEYTLANVAAGTLNLRAELIGYGSSTRSATVAAGETATVNFNLATSSISLDAIVVTGTPGATEKRSLGNAVAQIDAAQITEQVPVATVSQLLQSRTPGLTITSASGTSGTAANISIRGLNSLYGRNRPLIYVDGVRMNDGTYNIGSGGQDMDVLANIDPNDIESVEVIKGPAAATLYGSEAAAGVIQIITKKGQVGDQKVQFSVRGEYGRSDWGNAWMPTNYWTCSNAEIRNGNAFTERPRTATGAFASWVPGCAGIDTVAAAQDPSRRLISGMALRDYLSDGNNHSIDLAARGGGDRYSFYLSGDRSEVAGIFPTEQNDRTTLRGNFFVQPRDNMDVALNMSLSRSFRNLPQNDNNSWGYLRNSYRGRPGWLLNSGYEIGWLGLSPLVIDQVVNTLDTDKLVASVTANWQPWSWFRNRVTVGVDASDQENESWFARDQSGRAPFGATAARGYIAYWNPQDRDYTIDYAGTISTELPRDLSSQTSFGMQYSGEHYHAFTSEGIGLAFRPIRQVSTAEETNAYEAFSDQASVGVFVQQQIGWRDRLFVTGALRADDNSSFGNDFDYQIYPKLAASYVISEEPFFNIPAISELKLRGAWGKAGTSPNPYTADRSYSAGVILLANDATATGLFTNTFGNPELQAEIGTELELGFDAAMLNDRLSLEGTFYNTYTRNLLLNVPVAPSTGFSGSRQANAGELLNRGFELAVNGTILQRSGLRWESRLSAGTNKNELVSFSDARDEPIIFGYSSGAGANQRFAEGYPVAGYWTRDVRRNADGSVILNAAGRASLVPSDSATYLGPSQPTREASLTNTFTVMNNLQLYTFVDYKGGHYLYNMVQRARDADGVSWEVNNPDRDPQDYATRISGSDIAYIQKADFLRLREVSATYNVPSRFTGRFRTDNLSLSLAGRNLALWSKYPGSDPEVNVEGVDNFTRGDFYSVPNLRQIVATVNVRF